VVTRWNRVTGLSVVAAVTDRRLGISSHEAATFFSAWPGRVLHTALRAAGVDVSCDMAVDGCLLDFLNDPTT
jgi:hypothetical protein